MSSEQGDEGGEGSGQAGDSEKSGDAEVNAAAPAAKNDEAGKSAAPAAAAEKSTDPARRLSGELFRRIFFHLSARDICHATCVSFVTSETEQAPPPLSHVSARMARSFFT